jgi:hypothetical protein
MNTMNLTTEEMDRYQAAYRIAFRLAISKAAHTYSEALEIAAVAAERTLLQ